MIAQAIEVTPKLIWDRFVRESKNGTFLFFRDYLSYHAERYEDASGMYYNEDGKLMAVMPAHLIWREHLVSHAGLTYGGIVVGHDMTLPAYLNMVDGVLTALKKDGIRTLRLNTSPFIYHKAPADECLVALYLLDAPIVRTCALSVIMPGSELVWEKRRNRGIEKAQRAHLYTARSDDYAQMWDMLKKVLPGPPTHSLDEILLLRSRFPYNIKLYGCYAGRDMLAGVVIYETDKVARAQYIATSQQGKLWGAGDLLMSYLIETYTHGGKAFDMGTSSSSDGRELSQGILEWKEGWGCRTVAYSHYEIRVDKYEPGFLRKVLK